MHTGSIAGSDQIYDATFKQAGVIRTSDGAKMIEVAKALSLQRMLPKGKRVAILTNLGGLGVLALMFVRIMGLDCQKYRK